MSTSSDATASSADDVKARCSGTSSSATTTTQPSSDDGSWEVVHKHGAKRRQRSASSKASARTAKPSRARSSSSSSSSSASATCQVAKKPPVVYRCAGCSRFIISGNRYHCTSHEHRGANFDFCDVCFKRGRHKKPPHVGHKFAKLKATKPNLPPLTVLCDLCRKAIDASGPLYECVECEDFDLCRTCKADQAARLKSRKHDIKRQRAGANAAQLLLAARDAQQRAQDDNVLVHELAHKLRRYDSVNASPRKRHARARLQAKLDALTEHVFMLFVRVTINGKELDAMIDTGAQTTVMSTHLAAKCGLLEKLDGDFAGIASGVGQAFIRGRALDVSLKIAGRTYTNSVTIVDANNMGFLLGLDFIRTYNVVIDATGARPFMRIGKRRVALLDEHDLLPSEDDEPIHFAAGSPCIMQ